MVRLPRDITPGQAARRALLADFAIALLLTLAAVALAAGIGVVGFFALLVFLVTVAWAAVERTVRTVLRVRARHRAPDIRLDRNESIRPDRRHGSSQAR
jgi:hypothetical protein